MITIGLCAVSYTHLDVYKRQVQNNAVINEHIFCIGEGELVRVLQRGHAGDAAAAAGRTQVRCLRRFQLRNGAILSLLVRLSHRLGVGGIIPVGVRLGFADSVADAVGQAVDDFCVLCARLDAEVAD